MNIEAIIESKDNLRGADLRRANLWDADLRDANLRGADLCGADLSGATGLLSAAQWMADNFETTEDGYVVYKAVGQTHYETPTHWKITPNSYLKEIVNPDRGTDCGCGVNFATHEWCLREFPQSTIWKCIIEWRDLPGVVVPFNTDDKARCERLRLVQIIELQEVQA